MSIHDTTDSTDTIADTVYFEEFDVPHGRLFLIGDSTNERAWVQSDTVVAIKQ